MRETVGFKVSEGHTLLVKGPASVKLYEGRVHTYLAELEPQRQFVVPEGRRIPIEALRESSLKISIGLCGSVEEVEGPSLPESWMSLISGFNRDFSRSCVVIIMGEVDSGKNSLATVLANHFMRHAPSVSILDLDVGQAEISFPASIAIGETATPIHGLYEVRSKAACFIGSITPSPATDRIVRCLRLLMDKRPPSRPLIVNTDGWIEDENAQAYKSRLVKVIRPDHIILIGQLERYSSILNEAAPLTEVSQLERSQLAYKRSREERRRLRERAYQRSLKEGSVREFPLLKLKWGLTGVVRTTRGEVNLLSGLLDPDGFAVGIGVLKKVDHVKGTARIFTPVSAPVESIEVGLVKVRENGKEIDSAVTEHF